MAINTATDYIEASEDAKADAIMQDVSAFSVVRAGTSFNVFMFCDGSAVVEDCEIGFEFPVRSFHHWHQTGLAF